MPAPRFLTACFTSALLSLAVVAAVNFKVDINRIYHADDSGEQKQISAYVEQLRHSAEGMAQTHWDRPVKWELAAQSTAECFVLGSSRAMIFGRDALAKLGENCASLGNVGVSGAGFEDFITAAGLIADKPFLRAVYVGVDPWAYRFNADARWTQFEAAYRQSRLNLGLQQAQERSEWTRTANLLNGQYFRRNLEQVAKGKIKQDIKEVAPGRANLNDDEDFLLPDGSLVYSRKSVAKPPPPDAQVPNGSTKIQPPYLDPTVAAEFEYVLDRLRSRGVRIVLLLSPYHPKVMRCESEKACEALRVVEAWATDLARRHGYGLIGSFDPLRFGLGPEAFHDELHIRASAIPKLAEPAKMVNNAE